MDAESPNPFDSLESSYEYVRLLVDALGDAQRTIEEDLAEAAVERATRRVEALHLVRYKLTQLHEHLRTSRRILNDLRMLRRIILDGVQAAEGGAAPEQVRTRSAVQG